MPSVLVKDPHDVIVFRVTLGAQLEVTPSVLQEGGTALALLKELFDVLRGLLLTVKHIGFLIFRDDVPALARQNLSPLVLAPEVLLAKQVSLRQLPRSNAC